jgi:isocitrate dehydrogenase
MLLRHLDEFEAATRIENAVLATFEQGHYTSDVRPDGALGTRAFTDKVIAHLGQRPKLADSRPVKTIRLPQVSAEPNSVRPSSRRIAGFDVFIESASDPQTIGRALEELVVGSPVRLKMISNRGTQVYPLTGTPTDCVDHWRCRFITRADTYQLRNEEIWDLISKIQRHFSWMHLEKLQEFDGAIGWTRAQGEGETPGA